MASSDGRRHEQTCQKKNYYFSFYEKIYNVYEQNMNVLYWIYTNTQHIRRYFCCCRWCDCFQRLYTPIVIVFLTPSSWVIPKKKVFFVRFVAQMHTNIGI